jgi:hypothetical protein
MHQTTEDESEMENNNNLPLEEMKYIEWKSDSSEEENFQLVKSRKSKKERGE